MRELIGRAEIAERLAVSVDWFNHHWGRLVREHGFPRPMPGFPRQRWDPRAIELWQDAALRAQGLLPPVADYDARADPAAGAAAPGADPDLDEVLARRGRAIAGGVDA